jgi:phosphoglycolate phosphatase-like HAD superfamily hydrolase
VRALVVFDFDSVIYRAASFLADAYREALNHITPPLSPEAILGLNHGIRPLSAGLRNLFPNACGGEIDALFVGVVRAMCAHSIRGEGSITPGLRETLVALQLHGYTLATVSDGPRTFVRLNISTNELNRYLSQVFAVDSRLGLSKWELLRQHLLTHGINQDRVIIVGGGNVEVECRGSGLKGRLIRYASDCSGASDTRTAVQPVSTMAELANAITRAQPWATARSRSVS